MDVKAYKDKYSHLGFFVCLFVFYKVIQGSPAEFPHKTDNLNCSLHFFWKEENNDFPEQSFS